MSEKEDLSIFKQLSDIDIANKVKRKGKFNYISWASAVRAVSKVFPNMTWEMHKFDGMPYLKTELGYFVEVSVTINDLKRTQLMPILNHNNNPIENPTTFDINKSQQRALAKAISLHGLGLDLWAGEDLDETKEEEEIVLISGEDIKTVKDLARENKDFMRVILKSYGIGKIEDLYECNAKECIQKIEKYIEKKKAKDNGSN